MGERKATTVHISSAVIVCLPGQSEDIARTIAALPDTEIHFIQNGKIVVVMEGESVGVVGDRLAAIAGLDGVLSASLVFEQIANLDELGEPA